MKMNKETIKEVLKRMGIILVVVVVFDVAYLVIQIAFEEKPQVEETEAINLLIPAEQLTATKKLIAEGKNLTNLVEGLLYYPPGIGMYDNYAKDSKTYESKIGFSFLYPNHLFVMEDPEALIPERLFVLPTSTKDNDTGAIIISVAENDENIMPLEWLDTPASGADLPQEGYVHKWDLDNQEAIAIEGGSWVVVNVPGDQYRLSIAILPGDSGMLITEMGMIIDSLKFLR